MYKILKNDDQIINIEFDTYGNARANEKLLQYIKNEEWNWKIWIGAIIWIKKQIKSISSFAILNMEVVKLWWRVGCFPKIF